MTVGSIPRFIHTSTFIQRFKQTPFLQGLCGTFNLNQKDDFLTPEGDVEQTALAFANKWKTREFCDDVQMTEPEHPCKANVENKETAEKYCSKLKSKLFDCKYRTFVLTTVYSCPPVLARA